MLFESCNNPSQSEECRIASNPRLSVVIFIIVYLRCGKVTQSGVNASGKSLPTLVFIYSPEGRAKYTSHSTPNSARTCEVKGRTNEGSPCCNHNRGKSRLSPKPYYSLNHVRQHKTRYKRQDMFRLPMT